MIRGNMKTYHSPQSLYRRLTALVLVCSCILLSLVLLFGRENSKAPKEESAATAVKTGSIVFSKPSGFYEDPFTLQIKAPTAEIYYTLDGSEPVRGQEGTFLYEDGISIDDATSNDNLYSLRTDVTTGFDLDAVENLSKGRRVMNYRVPDYPVDKCTVVRAVFYDLNDQRSEIETGSYFVGYKGREGYGSARVISIVTDPANLFDYEKGIYVTGKTFDDFAAADSFHNDDIWYRHFWWWWDANYHNQGDDWERQANIQFFSEDGELLLQQESGIRIQGGGSRGFLPKSLNLYARKTYDGNNRFLYDFFGTGYTPKRMTLTCGGDDCYTKQKDRLVSELAADQGFATMHYVPCLLFLDGEFWGFYYLTEKYDDRYFSYYYDVPREEIVEIKNNEIEIGEEKDLALYQELKSFIEESDMSVEANYQKACEMMDMDSFINYYAALIYCSRSGDWPNGNFALWRTRQSKGNTITYEKTGGDVEYPSTGSFSEESSDYRDGRWRWVLFDVNSAAISSELKDHDTLKYVIKTNKMKMFGSLWNNPGFRKKFEERILEYGNTIFTPGSVKEKTDQYAEQMTDPMKIHFRRFFGEDSGLDFNQIVDTEINSFFEDRYSVVEKILAEHSEGQ